MTRTVRTLGRAQRDVSDIWTWLAERSADGANRWLNRLAETVKLLAANPAAFGIAPESQELSAEVRQALFKTRRGRRYRVLFIVRDNEVIVLRVRGAREAPVQPDDLDLDAADS